MDPPNFKPPLPFKASTFGVFPGQPRARPTTLRTLNSEEPDVAGKLPEWSDYYDEKREITKTSEKDEKVDRFNVYEAGKSGPLVVALHGGGHTALSWSLVATQLKDKFHIVAYDARGHGETACVDNSDLSISNLVEDGVFVVSKVYEEAVAALESEDKTVPVLLIGHSMGGAVATKMAATGRVPNLQGLIVLDVVEGTALEALPNMRIFVQKFPAFFPAPSEAVDWALSHGVLSNRRSAVISIPSQLVQREEEEYWTWRVDLAKTEQYWKGWFEGMSQDFLNSKCCKVLVLAGHDRLDPPLMIAHMQGKYQLQLVPKAGHIIEEDQPDQVVDIVRQFAHRYRLFNPIQLPVVPS